MKLKTIAAVCALAFASQAYALDPATTVAGSTNHLFISGSSALQLTIGQIAASLYTPSSIDVYLDGGTGANYRAYSGTFKSGITGITGGSNGVVYEMAKGGSLMGVLPVASASATNPGLSNTQILSISTTNCSAMMDGATPPAQLIDPNSGGRLWNCGPSVDAVPDAGVADVEPALFTGFNVPAGSPSVSPAVVAALDSKPTLAQPMGIILTDNMTSTLPSLTKGQVTGLMSGYNVDWSWVDSTLSPGQVIVCRRTPGSGTQASINDFFFAFPCSASALAPAAHQHGAAGAQSVVIENTSSGALAKCMGYAQNGTPAGQTIDITSGAVSTAAADANHIVLSAGGRAIGLMGLDRPSQNATTEPYHFAQIDGVAATVENAVTGAYDVVVNNSWSKRISTTNGIAPMSGVQLAFFNAMKANSGNKLILGASKTPPVAGVAALADPVALNFDPTLVASGPFAGTLLNPVMRVDKPTSCAPAQQVQ